MVSASDRSGAGRPALNVTFLVVAVAAGLGLLFNMLLFGYTLGVAFPIYVVLVLAGLLLVAQAQKLKLPHSAVYMVPLLLFFSTMVAVRDSELLTFINVVTSLYLLGLLATLTAKPRLQDYKITSYLKLLIELPLQVIDRAFEQIGDLFRNTQLFRKHRSLPHILRGLVIAIPAVLVFVALFASADLVFREYVNNIFSFNLDGELVGRIVVFLFVTFVLIGYFGSIGRQPKEQVGTAFAKAKSEADGQKGAIEANILFGSLNVLFFCFIMVQLSYLFGGLQNVTGSDFTYAEYARKGFFELTFAAGLSGILVVVADHMLPRRGGKHSPAFKFLAGALIAQVLVMMVSAFKRLALYEGAYGFTVARLLGYTFIIWLAVVLGVLLYKIIADRREQLLALTLFASSVVVFAALNIMNVDHFVANQNVKRYGATGKIDVAYLRMLSADAIPVTVTLLNDRRMNDEDRQLHGESLSDQYSRLQGIHGWQSYNLSRERAVELLDRHMKIID